MQFWKSHLVVWSFYASIKVYVEIQIRELFIFRL